MANERHLEQAQKLVELLKTVSFTGFAADEVQLSDVWNDPTPPRGIHVSMATEETGVGVNEKDDIRYVCTVVRVIPGVSGKSVEGMLARSEFRVLVRQLFHKRRIGVNANEILTKVRPLEIKNQGVWKTNSLDVSAMRVTTLIRELRGTI